MMIMPDNMFKRELKIKEVNEMAERNLDFDQIIDRRNTKCIKYDFTAKIGYPKDVLPLWVADMDFKTSSYVEDALQKLIEHNIYGYTNIQKGDGF